MRTFIDSVREETIPRCVNRTAILARDALIFLAAGFTVLAETPAPAAAPQAPTKPTALVAALDGASHTSDGALNEEQIKLVLVGKTFYLRGDYLDNTLEFDEHGNLTGHSQRGSYTLCAIKIDKAKLSKHKVELDGARYALHFLGELPHEDPLKDVDRVKITPKKKVVKITIVREQVEKPKKAKHKGKDKIDQKANQGLPESQTAAGFATPPAGAKQAAAVSEPPLADPSADGKHSTTTTSPAHASQTLINALDRVFAQEIDDRMIADMPDFWKLFYKASAANADYSPTDPGVFRQSNVDQKAKLLTAIEPPSNDFAQTNGVAGMALYHAIVGSDGRATQVVAGRPIGFGLDENAVDTICKASFQPATKDGKPVPVALDLVVSFRIYSKRTSQPAIQQATDGSTQPVLPGPYSVQRQ